MRTHDFRVRYKLLKRMTKRGAVTYHALDANGQFVMVHVLPGSPHQALRKLLSALDQLDDRDRVRFRAVVQVEGRTVVISDLLGDFDSFASWLHDRMKDSRPNPDRSAGCTTRALPAAAGETAGRAAAAGETVAAKKCDEFERLFGPRPESEHSDIPHLPPEIASKPPGEFTLLFGATTESDGDEPQRSLPSRDERGTDPSAPAAAVRPAAQQRRLLPPSEGPYPPPRPVVRWADDRPPAPAPAPAPATRLRRPPARPVWPLYRDDTANDYLEALAFRSDEGRSGLVGSVAPAPPSIEPPIAAPAPSPLATPLDLSAAPSEYTLVVSGGSAGGARSRPNDVVASFDAGGGDGGDGGGGDGGDGGGGGGSRCDRVAPVERGTGDARKLVLGLGVLGLIFVLVVVVALIGG